MKLLTSPLILASDAAIDLQVHTIYSDGHWTPQQLIDYLVEEQFALVAVTDHHRIDTVAHIQSIGARRHLPVLAGVEMSTTWHDKEVDVLCYGFDGSHSALSSLADDIVLQHMENAREVATRLHLQGYTFPRQQEVLQMVGGQPRHANDLALLMQAHGYGCSSVSIWQILYEAGAHWSSTDLSIVVDAAHSSSAVCVIAHPGKGGENHTGLDISIFDQLFQEVPIDGLEVYHPQHTSSQIAMYLKYAHEHELLISSGSDSHGPHQPPVKYSARLSQSLLERIGIQIK